MNSNELLNIMFIVVSTTMFLTVFFGWTSYMWKLRVRTVDEEIQILEENANPIMQDLLSIIERECKKVVNLKFTYTATKHTYSLEHSSLINPMSIIKDSDINTSSIDVSIKILNDMSDSYRDRISLVIKESRIDEFILEEVYFNLFNKAIEINRGILRRSNN